MKDVSVPYTQGMNKNVKTALMILLIILVIVVVYQIYKAIKAAGDAAGDIVGADIVFQKTGVSPDRQRVCKTVAANCENAITRVPIIGTKIWCADDDVVNALNSLVSANETILTCTYFQQGHGDSLKSVVEGGLFVEDNRKRITFRSSLV